MNINNWEARVRRLAEGAKYATGYEAEVEATNDPGHVPPYVMPRLAAFAQGLGYPLRQVHLPEGLLGRTANSSGGCDCGRMHQKGIEILRGMSPASTARVMGHELGHAIAHLTATAEDHRRHQNAKIRGDEDLVEEVACELGTAAFCDAMGIGSGLFLHRYMGQRLEPGTTVPDKVIRKAAKNAQALWEAVQSS